MNKFLRADATPDPTRWEPVDYQISTRFASLKSGDRVLDEITERLRVPGGWLYRVIRDQSADCPECLAMVFVPEPWSIRRLFNRLALTQA